MVRTLLLLLQKKVRSLRFFRKKAFKNKWQKKGNKGQKGYEMKRPSGKHKMQQEKDQVA